MTQSLAALCANKDWEGAEKLLNDIPSSDLPGALASTHGTSKWTPLHYAALTIPTPGILDTLLRLGASPSAQGSAGSTPLHLAAWYGTQAVEKLIQAGADLDSRTLSGRTALHFAAFRGNVTAVENLVKAGGKDCGDGDGVSAREFARAGGFEEVISVLDEYSSAGDDIAPGMTGAGRDDDPRGGAVRRTGLAALVDGNNVKEELDRFLGTIRGDVVMAGAVGFVLGVLAPRNGR